MNINGVSALYGRLWFQVFNPLVPTAIITLFFHLQFRVSSCEFGVRVVGFLGGGSMSRIRPSTVAELVVVHHFLFQSFVSGTQLLHFKARLKSNGFLEPEPPCANVQIIAAYC